MASSLILARLLQVLTWAIPVKIEELKAGLRAYMYAWECRKAFQRCVDDEQNCKRSIARLPAEMVDEIIWQHLFGEIRAQFGRDWAMRYLCSSTNEDIRTIGTAWRFTATMREEGKAHCREALVGFSTTICTLCRALRQVIPTQIPDDGPEQDVSNTQLPPLYCQACMACHNLGFDGHDEPLEGFADDDLVDEYLNPFVLEDNPWDKHPESQALLTHMSDNTKDDWNDGIFHYAGEWQEYVSEDGFLTNNEAEFFDKHFNMHCYVQTDTTEDFDRCPQHTTALLWPTDVDVSACCWEKNWLSRGFGKRGRLDMRTAAPFNPTVLTLEQDKWFKDVLKELQLTTCTHLLRQDCSEAAAVESSTQWPQFVALAIAKEPELRL